MQNVAVFDFDGTVIRSDSIIALVGYAFRRRLIRLPELMHIALCFIRHRCKKLDVLDVKRATQAFLSRMDPKAREEFLRAFAQTLVNRAYPEAVAQMRAHKENGDVVLLCSASCDSYMKYVAAMLPVDDLLCTPCDDTGYVLGPNCRWEEKVTRVRAWLKAHNLPDNALSAGYGDTLSDHFILEICREPVLVNPKAALVQKMPHARQVQWHEAK